MPRASEANTRRAEMERLNRKRLMNAARDMGMWRCSYTRSSPRLRVTAPASSLSGSGAQRPPCVSPEIRGIVRHLERRDRKKRDSRADAAPAAARLAQREEQGARQKRRPRRTEPKSGDEEGEGERVLGRDRGVEPTLHPGFAVAVAEAPVLPPEGAQVTPGVPAHDGVGGEREAEAGLLQRQRERGVLVVVPALVESADLFPGRAAERDGAGRGKKAAQVDLREPGRGYDAGRTLKPGRPHGAVETGDDVDARIGERRGDALQPFGFDLDAGVGAGDERRARG